MRINPITYIAVNGQDNTHASMTKGRATRTVLISAYPLPLERNGGI